MSSFHLKLNKDQYYPGDVLLGEVKCDFDTTRTIKDIEVKLRGEEQTLWRRKARDGAAQEAQEEYSGFHRFLATNKNLAMAGECLDSGQYIYPFSFKLPNEVPASYCCGDDHVKYFVRLVVRCCNNDEVVLTKNFDVVAPLMYLVNRTNELKLSENGWVNLQIALKKNAFDPGEEIKVKLIITNPAKLQVGTVTVDLAMQVELIMLHPRRKNKIDYLLLAREQQYDGGAHKRLEYTFLLSVPENVYVPDFTGCKLFRLIPYNFPFVKVTVSLPACDENVEVILPIILRSARSATAIRSSPNLPPEDDLLPVEKNSTLTDLPPSFQSLGLYDPPPSAPKLNLAYTEDDLTNVPSPHKVFDPPYPPAQPSVPRTTEVSSGIQRPIGFHLPDAMQEPYTYKPSDFSHERTKCVSYSDNHTGHCRTNDDNRGGAGSHHPCSSVGPNSGHEDTGGGDGEDYGDGGGDDD